MATLTHKQATTQVARLIKRHGLNWIRDKAPKGAWKALREANEALSAGAQPPEAWTGLRIKTRVSDCNEVANLHEADCKGNGCVGCRDIEMHIPIGWCGTVGQWGYRDSDGLDYYEIHWDDDPQQPGGKHNMGVTTWSTVELLRDAEIIPAAKS